MVRQNKDPKSLVGLKTPKRFRQGQYLANMVNAYRTVNHRALFCQIFV